MPTSRFDKGPGVPRNVKASPSPESGATHDAASDAERYEDYQTENLESLRERLRSKRQEYSRIKEEQDASKKGAERREQIKRLKKKRLEIVRLRDELRASQKGRAVDDPAGRTVTRAASEEPQTGTLPDFAVIGAAKSGTTYFYHLLTQHPHIEPAAFKEPHFFDLVFDEGIEWYRRCFPAPRWKDGRRTITGEGTPGYLFHPLVPERMAEVVPHARLIALLRNPVDRTYSAYHHRARNGRVTRTFEETVEDGLRRNGAHLSKSIYIDHLLRWSEFFPREQMLVLKSEDFFDNPQKTLKTAFSFLDLPEWEPDPSELENKRNAGGYGQRIDPTTRRRLEAFFEPHNRRLYDFLGTNFGW